MSAVKDLIATLCRHDGIRRFVSLRQDLGLASFLSFWRPPMGVELLVGFFVGVGLTGLVVCAGCCRWRKSMEAREVARFAEPEWAPCRGSLQLPPRVASFSDQLSFVVKTFAPLRGLREPRRAALYANGQEVAGAVGRLMVPNGEVRLVSLSEETWALLRWPAPSRNGELWGFKVCTPDETPCALVRQRSQMKCVVDAVAVGGSPRRRLMIVVGNFAKRAFVTRERTVNIWTSQGAHPTLGGQCESLSVQGPHFHVQVVEGVDAALVLSVLIGLQEIHEAHACQESPAATSPSAPDVPSPEVASDV